MQNNINEFNETIKKENCYIHIKTTDVIRFESALKDSNIEFYKNKRHIDIKSNIRKDVKYYFKEKDFGAIDNICIELDIIRLSYTNKSSFATVNLILLIIGIIIAVISFTIFLTL
jgi:NifB/MoaA-like Fe-S oxidoreductase